MFGSVGPFSSIDASIVLHLDPADTVGSDINDRSKTGLDGVLTNGATYSASNGGVIDFDGVNDSVDMGESKALDFGTDGCTVSAWAYWNSASSFDSVVMICGYTPLQGGFVLYFNTNKVTMYANVLGSQTLIGSTTAGTISASNWYHIVMTRSGNNVNIYINKTKYTINSSFTAFLGNASPSNQSYLGKVTGASLPFNGTIGVVRAYTRAFTDAEVNAQYDAETSRY